MPKTRFVINCSLPQDFLDQNLDRCFQAIVLGLARDVNRDLGISIDIKKAATEFDVAKWQQKFCFEVELDSKHWFQLSLQEHNAVDKLTDCVRTNLIQRLGLLIL